MINIPLQFFFIKYFRSIRIAICWIKYMFLQIVKYIGFKGVINMFQFIKYKLRKALDEKFVLSAYLLTIAFLFIISLVYDLGKKIGGFIMVL